jgi:DNA repair exonuclease SbcCD ATPase subunit
MPARVLIIGLFRFRDVRTERRATLMITTCPTCGCTLYLTHHETYSDCLRALEVEQKLLSQRIQRVIKLAEQKIADLESEIQRQKGD